MAANVGDARVVLVRGGQAIQLTVDHKVKLFEYPSLYYGNQFFFFFYFYSP